MEKEALIELMREIMPTMVEEMILPEVRKENGKFAASLNKKLEKANQPEAQRSEEGEESKLTLKVLQQQVDSLKAELGDKERKALEAQRKAAISEVIANSKAISKSQLQKLFSFEYENSLEQEGNRWIYKSEDGQAKFLEDLLDEYLGSADGKLFLPASNVSGSGSTETKSQIVNPSKELTLEQQYAAMQQSLFG